MAQITQKDLEYLVKRINEVTKSPKEPYYHIEGKDGKKGKFISNIGNYHLDYAYGGVQLVRMVSEGGGIETISRGCHVPKRELYNWMRAYVAGLYEAEKCPGNCCYGTSRENCTLGKETASECNSPS